MPIDYTTVIKVNIADSAKASQVNSILSQVASTPEGQLLLSRIQQGSGTINVTNVAKQNSTYDPDSKSINLDWEELATTRFATSSGLQTLSINSTIVHELYHAADTPFDPSHSASGHVAQEYAAVQYTNLFMDKYYHGLEPQRGRYDDGVQNQPPRTVPYFDSLNHNPDFKTGWWGPKDMNTLLTDPDKRPWYYGVQEYLFGADGEADGTLNYFDAHIHDTNEFDYFFDSMDMDEDWGGDWGDFGDENSYLEDNSFELGGGKYTLFGEGDRIAVDGLFINRANPGEYWLNGGFRSTLNQFAATQNRVSPLVFDLNGNGIESTAIYDTRVFFDIDNDGFAEKVGWIKPTDGFLAIDSNGNGRIDNITELYGDDVMPAFDKLRKLDSTRDGVIDAADAQFADLLLWRDLNSNGLTDAGELQSLTAGGIKSISLRAANDNGTRKTIAA